MIYGARVGLRDVVNHGVTDIGAPCEEVNVYAYICVCLFVYVCMCVFAYV